MMMFVQLLVFTCACAMGAVINVPPYGNILEKLREAKNILDENVLSTDDNVPLLEDPRRHYTEIVHVISDEARHEDSCIGHDYYKDYQHNVNESASFGFSNPQKVVSNTKKVVEDISSKLSEVIELINNCTGNEDCDDTVHEAINKNEEKLGWQRDVLLAAGEVADQLNSNHGKFSQVSNKLAAHIFVIQGASQLEHIVMALKELYHVLYQPSLTC